MPSPSRSPRLPTLATKPVIDAVFEADERAGRADRSWTQSAASSGWDSEDEESAEQIATRIKFARRVSQSRASSIMMNKASDAMLTKAISQLDLQKQGEVGMEQGKGEEVIAATTVTIAPVNVADQDKGEVRMDMTTFVRNAGLDAHWVDVFAKQEIDISMIAELTDADLVELGMKLGPRRKLLRAAKAAFASIIATNNGESI